MPPQNLALPQADDPLGLFEPLEVASAPTSGGMVSFGVSDAPAQPTVQPVRLPADIDAAAGRVAQMRSAMQRGQRQLAKAEHQIADLRHGFRPVAERSVSFAAPVVAEPEVMTPELSLYSTLDAIELTPPEQLENVRQEQQGEVQKWRQFVAQVQQKISYPVQVQTQMGASLIGYTTMDWSGDFTTVWRPDLSGEAMVVHSQTVDLVLAKIMARLRLVTTITTEAGKLAAKLTVPGSQVLVIPAVWRFVRESIEALRSQPEFQS